MNTELTKADLNKLKNVSKSWIKQLPEIDVEDFLQDAIANALATVGSAPAGVTFEKHTVYHIITLARKLRMRAANRHDAPLLPLDAASDVAVTEGSDDDYQSRRELREFIVHAVLDKMNPKASWVLIAYYVYGQQTKELAGFKKVTRRRMRQILAEARQQFAEVAESLGLLVTQMNVEPGSMWPEKPRRLPCPPDAWYRTENETDPLVFRQADLGLCRSSGQESMQLRVSQLRAASRSHSQDVQHGTTDEGKIETQP